VEFAAALGAVRAEHQVGAAGGGAAGLELATDDSVGEYNETGWAAGGVALRAETVGVAPRAEAVGAAPIGAAGLEFVAVRPVLAETDGARRRVVGATGEFRARPVHIEDTVVASFRSVRPVRVETDVGVTRVGPADLDVGAVRPVLADTDGGTVGAAGLEFVADVGAVLATGFADVRVARFPVLETDVGGEFAAVGRFPVLETDVGGEFAAVGRFPVLETGVGRVRAETDVGSASRELVAAGFSPSDVGAADGSFQFTVGATVSSVVP
jgi:hypothetical protein